MTSELQFTSWNVRGLNKLVKLKQVMNRIQQLKAKVIFLQETHLTSEEIVRVGRRWPGQVFSASFSSHSRGVITLIHKSLPFQLIDITQDKFGRYLVIQCEILSVRLNLVNVYGTNKDDPAFFRHLFLSLAALPGHLVIGGDFNRALQSELDRSTGIDTSHPQARKELLQCMKDFNLIDVWRNMHPSKQTFSCYSSTYQTFSRIDYFLISADLIHKITSSWYDSILISDHAPTSFLFKLPSMLHHSPRWWLQPSWLRDPEFIKFIGTQIDLFFENNTDQTSASVRWEASKAFLRGQMISFISFKHKSQRSELEQLEKAIKEIENQIYQNPNQQQILELHKLRAKYNGLSTNKATRSLLRLRQSFYEQGEKAGSLLAWCIKQMQTERTINSVQTDEGLMTSDPKEINNTFLNFYHRLYSSEYSDSAPDYQITFLDSLDFIPLDEDSLGLLEFNLGAQDLSEAISNLKGGKTPGPDEIPVELYKIFKTKLSPPLLEMYQESFNNGVLPLSLSIQQ